MIGHKGFVEISGQCWSLGKVSLPIQKRVHWAAPGYTEDYPCIQSFQDGSFRGHFLIGEGPKSFLLLETSHTYPTMMKLMWRRYISHTYPPQNIGIMWATSWVYWKLYFSPESSNKCYMGEKRQKTHFILNLSFLRLKSFQSLL